MLESFNGYELKYQKLSPEEMQERCILGRLVGPMADTTKGTRNGRMYSKELWDKALNDEMFKEKLENKTVLAELDHPADRTEIKTLDACAALAEMPKLGKDGLIYGVWDILDTAAGKVLNTLCRYGTKIGISSRGEGDVEEDFDGNESVDPDTYSLETWDMVLMPSVKEARMTYVTEALDKKRYNKTLRKALTEELDKASADERNKMKETLDRLNIKLEEEKLDEKTSFDGLIYAEKLGRVMKDQGKSDEQIAEVFRLSGMDENEIKDTLAMLSMKDESCNEDFWNPSIEAKKFFDIEEIDSDEWNNASLEEREEMVRPFVKEYIEKYPDTNWSILLSDLVDNNYHTEVKIFKQELGLNEELNSLDKKDDTKYFDDQIATELERLINLAREADVSGAHKTSEILQHAYDLIADNGMKIVEECNNDSCADIDESKSEPVTEEVSEAVDNSSMIEAIQDAISAKKELEEKVMSLQSEKAVSDAKVEQITEELNRYKNLSAQLSTVSKEAKSEAKRLSEALESKKDETTSKVLKESLKAKAASKKLNEALKAKDNEIKALNEQLNNAKADLGIKVASFNKKIEKQIKVTEAYKKAANSIMNDYINSKAAMLGVKPVEIRSRLEESYTVEDVNKVCEDLKAYKLSINSLPFKVGSRVNVKFTESKNDNLRVKNDADDIDDDLLQMAGLM